MKNFIQQSKKKARAKPAKDAKYLEAFAFFAGFA